VTCAMSSQSVSGDLYWGRRPVLRNDLKYSFVHAHFGKSIRCCVFPENIVICLLHVATINVDSPDLTRKFI
jgi:hypothetical protein